MRTVLTGLRSWPVVEAGGFQVAWRDGTGLHTGHLSDKGDMVVDSSTKMTGPGNPIALTDPAVVLGSTDGFDLWVPSRGPYVPSWNVITQVAAAESPRQDFVLDGGGPFGAGTQLEVAFVHPGIE